MLATHKMITVSLVQLITGWNVVKYAPKRLEIKQKLAMRLYTLSIGIAYGVTP